MKHGAIVQIAVARRHAMTVENNAQEMFNSWIVDVEMENQEVKSVECCEAHLPKKKPQT